MRRHLVVDRARRQVDGAGARGLEARRIQDEVVVVHDPVGHGPAARQMREGRGVAAAAEGREVREVGGGAVQHLEEVEALDLAVRDVEVALAVERADERALRFAFAGKRHLDAAPAGEPIEIDRIHQHLLHLDAGHSGGERERGLGAAAVEAHGRLAATAVCRELRQVGREMAVLEAERHRALVDLDLAELDRARRELEVDIGGLERAHVDGLVAPSAGSRLRARAALLRRQIRIDVERVELERALEVGLGSAGVERERALAFDRIERELGVVELDLVSGHRELARDRERAEAIALDRQRLARPRRELAQRRHL